MNLANIYKPLSDFINDSWARGESLAFYVDKMAIDLASSEIDSEDINRKRLESVISSTSVLLNNRHVDFTAQLLKFIFVLQKYVTDNYTSVNDFLSDNGIQVKPKFAEMSDTVGFPIGSSNVEGVS